MTDDQTKQNSDPNRSNMPADAAPALPASTKVGGAVVGTILLVAVAVGAYALLRGDSHGNGKSGLPERFQLDLTNQLAIPSDKITFEQTGTIDLKLVKPKAIAVGADGAIYVAGDRTIEVRDLAGSFTNAITLDHAPTCLAVAPAESDRPARLFVGAGRTVYVHDLGGELVRQWPELSEKSLVTAIAVAGDNVFVADAGQRVVLKCDREGRVVDQIGRADPDRKMPGFIIPSPYFDLVVGSDETLFVVNPGMRRVESYSFTGDLQSYWGRAGSRLGDFFGCCNPAHLERLPDGRFVTSEKGIPRVKIYTDGGDFDAVVAGPRELGIRASAIGDASGNLEDRVFDVAVGPRGAVLVLDGRGRRIRVFRSKESSSKAAP